MIYERNRNPKYVILSRNAHTCEVDGRSDLARMGCGSSRSVQTRRGEWPARIVLERVNRTGVRGSCACVTKQGHATFYLWRVGRATARVD